ncbi:prolipoprotein diacylglyceryl transferase [Mumia flava]|uniref:Phosphatidylglycerol--prolipoprotein diacylglyceryl transferase n=1 Tax=Mumia flava TaxID=1348852 RepID=A0A0B2BUF3_9ACTN|nr:prolipoprotein diacylglyceryl transferase [Mumia flava]PJJ55985.1 prolipoprotein diacylglyceryl transferase [Mumia flava]
MIVASIPSPAESVWHIGPFPLRAYALCIIAGVVAAIWVGDRRFQARGGKPGAVADIAIWAIPFGLVGARLYHVLTSPELYFADGRDPIRALYIWEGGLGIWGAISLGALGAYIGARRHGVRFLPLADALAPGILLGQAIGRWGNWFNQELYGGPTDRPWGLEIDPAHRPAEYIDQATFHPTFLYESIWSLVGFFVLIWADRRWRLGGGRVAALYVAVYTLGRFFVEGVRIDTAHEFLGLRLNQWTSLVLFALAIGYFVWRTRTGTGEREKVVQVTEGWPPQGEGPAGGAGDAAGGAAGGDAADTPDGDGDAVDGVADPDDASRGDAATDDVESGESGTGESGTGESGTESAVAPSDRDRRDDA